MRWFFGSSKPWMDERLSQKSHDEQAARSHREEKNMDWDQYNPPENWRAELADFFKQKVPNSPDEKDILKNIIRHTSGNTPISSNITKYFKMIYAIMTKKVTPITAGVQFNPDDHEAVAGTIRNIIEGLPACSDGTFERVKTVYDRWVSSISLHGFLMDFRTELVEKLARANFRKDSVGPVMETHRLNFYKVVANEMGINVSGAVEDKCYKDQSDKEKTKTKIEEEIKKNYTPIGIVKYMEDRLRGLVPEFTLPEKNAGEFRQAFEMRLHEHNETMKKIVGSLFDALQIKMPETVADYFITKKIILSYAPPEAFIAYENINWTAIRERIVDSLCEQDVIKNDAKEDKKKLLKPSIKNKSELLYWYNNIASDDDLQKFFNFNLLECIEFLFAIYTSDAKPEKLINAVGKDDFLKRLYWVAVNWSSVNTGTEWFFLNLMALYYYSANESKCNERLAAIHHVLVPHGRLSSFEMKPLINLISQLSDINIRTEVIKKITEDMRKYGSGAAFLDIYFPQLLHLTTEDYQKTMIDLEYKPRINPEYFISLIPIVPLFKTDDLKKQFLYAHVLNKVPNDDDDEKIKKIIEMIIAGLQTIKDPDPLVKKKIFLELFEDLPKELKFPVLSTLNEKKILSNFLFENNFQYSRDMHLSERSGFIAFLKACDEETLKLIFLNNDALSRLIVWRGIADKYILAPLKLPAVRVQYLKNIQAGYPETFLLGQEFYFKDSRNLEDIISYVVKEENRECVKPLMDLMGGIEAYIDVGQKRPTVEELIRIIKLLPEYTDRLIAKIGGMQNFITIVTSAVAIEANPNLLTEVLENLPESTRNAFLTEDNGMGMIRSVELLLLHQNFQTFFINVLNTLSDEQKITIVNLLALECFWGKKRFTHFEDPERLLAVLSELPNQAIQIVMEIGGKKIAALFLAMTTLQQAALLKLITNEDKNFLFRGIDYLDVSVIFNNLDKSSVQLLLPLIPLNTLENFKLNIHRIIENKNISLPEVINILKTHQPELTQAQMVNLFLKDIHENAAVIDLSAIGTDQPLFNLVKNLQELILLIQTVWGEDNLKDKMTHWLTQFPDGLTLIEKLFDDSEHTERYSQLSKLLSEDYLSRFINISHRTKLQDIISILSLLPDKQHRESIIAAISRDNPEFDKWLVKLVEEQPYKLTTLLSLIPENFAKALVDSLISKKIISTAYWLNLLSEEGRLCNDLAIICKYSKTGLTKSLLDSCGGLAAISTQASKLTDLIELINAIDPKDYAEDCAIDVSRLVVNQKDFHQLFNETLTLHYPLLLRSIDPISYINSTEDLVNLFKQIQRPEKLKALIEIRSPFQAYISYLLKNASIRELGNIIAAYQCEPKEKIKLITLCGGFRQRIKNMDELYQILARLPTVVHADWVKAYKEDFQEKSPQFRGGRVIVSPKSPDYELAATLAHCRTDVEKDRFIRNVTMENMVSNVVTPDELAALLTAFPDDPSYDMVQLPKNLADPTDLKNYEPNKIYLYIFRDEISGENKLGYTVLSRDQKELHNGTLEFDRELPEAITPNFIETLQLDTVLQQTSQHGDTLNANKTQLIQALGGMEKLAQLISQDPRSSDTIRKYLPKHLQNHDALSQFKEDNSAAQPDRGAAPAAKAAPAESGFFSFFKNSFASTPKATTQTEKTKAPASPMKK